MAHPNPLGHISLGVRDYTLSKAFYTAALTPLGLSLVYDSEQQHPTPSDTDTTTTPGTKKIRTLGYGPNREHELLNIFEHGDAAAAPGPGFHLAFNAPTRQAVIEFYDAALKAGGRDDGPPGLRERYGEGYFAAFVVDPDGWRLEVVCKDKV